MAVLRKPRLLFEVTVRRRPFFRRFAWSTLAALAGFAAVVALAYASDQAVADRTLLAVGQIVGVCVLVLFGLSALLNLWRGLRSQNERLRFYDKGFVWERNGKEHKHGWSQLESYREAGRGLYLGSHPLLQWGAQTLTMRDGQVYRLTGAHGDLRQRATAIRRYAAYVTGIQMGRILREEKPVKIHPRLTVWPGGVEVGKQEIPWSELDVRLKRGQLIIRRKNRSGKFKTVRRYNTRKVNNVGGFMELVSATIPNYQRERFEKRRSSAQA